MKLKLEDFVYVLPENRIAKFPANPRHHSKLLVSKGQSISHDHFINIDQYLPDNSLLILNNTRVIQARLIFRKKSGALIEIFCLEPLMLQYEVGSQLDYKNEVLWKCLVGNRKKWKNGEVLELINDIGNRSIRLKADLTDQSEHENTVRFSWNNAIPFSEILSCFGHIPLPPYLKREDQESDNFDYQTCYAQRNGAVAAPTAGLHFSPEVFAKLDNKGIKREFITLHVSAGTFKPITSENIDNHPMHEEQIHFSQKSLQNILAHEGPLICTGTTSLRAMESLYWFSVALKNNINAPFKIDKLMPQQFHEKNLPGRKESLEMVLEYMHRHKLDFLLGSTSVFIYPPYRFHFCDGLITNYHLPKSTLILLVAAFAGEQWRKIYQEALKNDYRFLSYGDSSLILP